MRKILCLFIMLFVAMSVQAQSPANYICDKFNGSLSDKITDRDFMGETYRCDIKSQWDMTIQSEINELVLHDSYFGSGQGWEETFVDPENYNRLSFSFESDNYYIVNLYVPFEQKTDHFYIAE